MSQPKNNRFRWGLLFVVLESADGPLPLQGFLGQELTMEIKHD